MAKVGRPPSYTKKKANLICEKLAEGKPLIKICKMKGMPSQTTVMNWLWKESPYQKEFLEKYTRARAQQAEIFADEIISMADDVKQDVKRSALQVDTRKWVASKILPKKYGDKLELSGDKDSPIYVTIKQFFKSPPPTKETTNGD